MTDESEREPDGAVDGAADDPAVDGPGEPGDADGVGRDGTDAQRDATASVSSDGDATHGGDSHDATPHDADAPNGPSGTITTDGPDDDGSSDDGPLAADPVLDPESIDPSVLTVEQRSLHPRIRIVWLVRNLLVALVAGALAGVAAWALDRDPLVLAGAVGIVLLAIGIAFAVLRYRVWRYEVREDALYLERGVLTRVRTVVPTVRIQHVDTRRGPVDRVTGLATVVVYTAGSRGADVSIPGVAEDDADDLQQRLKRLAIASEADTSV